MKHTRVLLLFMLLVVPVTADAQSFSNVKVVFATSSTTPPSTPVLRWGEQTYEVEDQRFVTSACLRPAYPYGTAIPNGTVLEFPGDVGDSSSLAFKCFLEIEPGSCRRVSGVVLSQPDFWQAQYIVTSVGPC